MLDCESTLWLFNIAMENGLFIDDFPINTSIYKGFSMAMLNNQMVHSHKKYFAVYVFLRLIFPDGECLMINGKQGDVFSMIYSITIA